jgi:tRNA (mo5U34)-methyltransferase
MPAESSSSSSSSSSSPSGAVLAERVRALGPWFHNLRLGPDGTVQTAPEHFLGDFPANFWQFFQATVPADLTGKAVLDIGCNGGFYAFEMHRRGAARVLGIDHDPAYLRQAEFAREQLGISARAVEFRQLEVYDVASLLPERFDLVLFLGVLYHLRHPLYALEKVASLLRDDGLLLFQTMERGSGDVAEWDENYPISEKGMFFDDRFPRMFFVEKKYAGDPTNWWIPNPAASQAMLRSVGLRILEHPCIEVYLCQKAAGE